MWKVEQVDSVLNDIVDRHFWTENTQYPIEALVVAHQIANLQKEEKTKVMVVEVRDEVSE